MRELLSQLEIRRVCASISVNAVSCAAERKQERTRCLENLTERSLLIWRNPERWLEHIFKETLQQIGDSPLSLGPRRNDWCSRDRSGRFGMGAVRRRSALC